MLYIGEIAYRGNPLFFCLSTFNIGVQISLKLLNDPNVHSVPCNELPIIEPGAVIQEKFNIGNLGPFWYACQYPARVQNESYRNNPVQFVALFAMQGLIKFVGEETIFVHSRAQVRAPKQIRVEQQGVA